MSDVLLAGYTRNELISLAQSVETAMSDAFLDALGVKRIRRRKGTKKHRDRRYKGAKKLFKQRYGVRM